MMNLQVVSLSRDNRTSIVLEHHWFDTTWETKEKESDHECVRALEKLLTRDRLLRTFTPSRDAWIDKATRSHKTKIVSLKHQHQTYND